jgi:hypothetical protein
MPGRKRARREFVRGSSDGDGDGGTGVSAEADPEAISIIALNKIWRVRRIITWFMTFSMAEAIAIFELGLVFSQRSGLSERGNCENAL